MLLSKLHNLNQKLNLSNQCREPNKLPTTHFQSIHLHSANFLEVNRCWGWTNTKIFWEKSMRVTRKKRNSIPVCWTTPNLSSLHNPWRSFPMSLLWSWKTRLVKTTSLRSSRNSKIRNSRGRLSKEARINKVRIVKTSSR